MLSLVGLKHKNTEVNLHLAVTALKISCYLLTMKCTLCLASLVSFSVYSNTAYTSYKKVFCVLPLSCFILILAIFYFSGKIVCVYPFCFSDLVCITEILC